MALCNKRKASFNTNPSYNHYKQTNKYKISNPTRNTILPSQNEVTSMHCTKKLTLLAVCSIHINIIQVREHRFD